MFHLAVVCSCFSHESIAWLSPDSVKARMNLEKEARFIRDVTRGYPWAIFAAGKRAFFLIRMSRWQGFRGASLVTSASVLEADFGFRASELEPRRLSFFSLPQFFMDTDGCIIPSVTHFPRLAITICWIYNMSCFQIFIKTYWFSNLASHSWCSLNRQPKKTAN